MSMRLQIRCLAFLLCVAWLAPSVAQPAQPNAAQEARYRHLIEELRCVVCQNQTLAESNADLAVDLRGQVRAQIEQGRSDDQIKEYLVQRYGDFVLYRPPLQRNTWILWSTPFALLAVGMLLWWRLSRRRTAPRMEQEHSTTDPATTESLQQARRLLDD